MFTPPPPGQDDHDKISEQPLPPAHAPAGPSEEAPLAPNAPRVDDLFYYVLGCLEKGSSRVQVRKQLIAFGYTAAEADETVEAVADWRRKHPEHANITSSTGGGGGNASMWIGGLICLFGIVVTVGSCLAAGEGGGRYIIAWGAIIFGGIQFFRGLAQSKS